MIKHSTQAKLVEELFKLLDAHRGAFGQQRVYWRVVGEVTVTYIESSGRLA